MPHRFALANLRHIWSRRSLRVKLLAASALPIIAFLAAFALMADLDASRTAAAELAKNTQEIRAQLQNLFIVLISAESEVRNYGLNGREEGIEPLGMVQPSADAILAKVDDLVRGNQAQQHTLRQVRRLVHERLRGLTALRDYYRENHAPAKPSNELLAHSRLSPDVLLAVNEFATSQGKLQQARMDAEKARQGRLRNGIAALGAIGVLAALLFSLLFGTSLVRRVRALREAAAKLPEGAASLPVRASGDELGGLARAIEGAGHSVAAQREELKLALEGAGVLIWELEPAVGRIRYQAGSDALQNVTVPPELLPQTVNDWIAVVHPEDRDRVRGELNRIRAEGGSFQIEYRVLIRGGETRWMSVKARSHPVVEGAPPERLLGVLADITPQKRIAEQIERQTVELSSSREALQQQTRILKSILDSMGDAVVVMDAAAKFLVFNPAAKQMLGGHALAGEFSQWAQHYGLFLPDAVTLYPTDQLPIVRAIRGESVDDAGIFVRPAGASDGKWVSATARPLREDDGEVKGGIVVMRDVTGAKHAAEALETAKKEAEEANQAKSEFLSRMSHELRTPLNSILGFAQLLEMDIEAEQARDNIRQILKGGYHLLELINEILDLARIESGRLSLSPEPVRIGDSLRDAIDIVRPLAARQNVSINAGLAMCCERHVRADRQRLKQVLLNLLSNAIKFNRHNGSVTVSCEETPAKTLRLDIVDTGSGMSSEGIAKLFKPFERLGADAIGVPGTGLGLALTKRLMEAMGGTIGVESAVGLGSRFFLEFAASDDPTLLLESEDAAAACAGANSRPPRGTVLYIEDNASNLNLVERILGHCPGVSLLSAMQGQLGLDLAQLHTPDWILLDVHLPDIPGDEVLRRLQFDARTRKIPVTVLSADATAGQIGRLIDAGARDYLTKPLDVRNFLKLLENTLPNAGWTGDAMPCAYAERDHTS